MNYKIAFSLILLPFYITVSAKTYTLEQIKEKAINQNYKNKNSKIEIEEAKAQKKEAEMNYYPKVNATLFGMKTIDPLFKYSVQGGNLPVYDGNPANLQTATQFAYFPGINLELLNQLGVASANVTQTVYAGNRIKTGNELAKLNIDVKEKQQKLAQKEVLLKTEKEYWQVITLQEKLKTVESYENFLKKLHKEVSDAKKNGLAIRNDVLKIEIKISELKVNRTQLENGIMLATKQLAQTTGIEYNPNIHLTGDLNYTVPSSTFYVDKESVLPNREEIQLLEKSIEATKLQTKLKKGESLPSVAVGLSAFYLDLFEKNMDGKLNGMVFGTVSVPISNFWEDKHKLKQLKLKEELAENALKENSELLYLQIDKAWTDLKEAENKIKLYEETLVQTKENLRVEQQSYKNGLSLLSDVLQAQTQVNETEEKLIEAKSDYIKATNNYLIVTGR